MLIGRPPFETSNIKTTYRKIKSNDYRIPHTADLSEVSHLKFIVLEQCDSLSLSLSHSIRHTLIHSLTHSLPHSYTHSLTHSHILIPHSPPPQEAVSLIRASLDKDPACRPTLAAMRSHPFLTCAGVPPSLPVSALQAVSVGVGVRKGGCVEF